MGPGFRRDDAFLWDLRGLGLFFIPWLDRTGILALGVGVTVHELDDRHRRIVAVAIAGLQDPAVAARTRSVTLRQRRQQLVGELGILELGDRLPARVQPAALTERNQPLDDRAQVLSLRQSRADLLVLDPGRGEV